MLIKDNPYIPSEDKDFFVLLRIGLWQTVTEQLSPSPDWSYIYKLSCEQTVQGIVADGLAIIKAAYDRGQFNTPFPSGEGWGEAYDQFLSATAQIVRQNYKVNQTQLRLNALFSEAGIPFFVVKGQEAAKNYPKPMLRCSGDVDYAIRIQDFDKAVAVLTPIASNIEPYEADKQDQTFHVDDVVIELHGNLHPSLGSRVDNVLDTLYNEMFQGTTTYDTFSVLYIFLHCLQHYHWTGLGIRQITDLCMLIAKSNNADYARIQQVVSTIGITTEWSVFLSFCIDWLGLQPLKPSETIWNRSKSNETASLWEAFRQSGNFGHNIETTRHSNFLMRNFIGLYHSFSENYRTRHVSPSLSRTILGLRLNTYIQQFKKKTS